MKIGLRSTGAILLVLALMSVLVLPASSVVANETVSGQGVMAQTIAVFNADKFEPDNTIATAKVYDPAVQGNTWSSQRTFHGLNNVQDDRADFIKISITARNTPIWVETMYVEGWADTALRLYDGNMNLVADAGSHAYFYGSVNESLFYRAPATGTYYLEVMNASSYPFAYELHITLGAARRIAGPNRFATAAEIARLQWVNTNNTLRGPGLGPDTIVIANGNSTADMSVAAALATAMDGVLLLTHRDSLPWETKSELERITQSSRWGRWEVDLFVVGGEGAVGSQVFSKLQRTRGITSVERLAGVDRVQTALAVADVIVSRVGTSTAYIVNGHSWPDALSTSPVAGYEGAPILMTGRDMVPGATVNWLRDNGITNVVIVGGVGAVRDTVYDPLSAEFTTIRIDGQNRFETAKNVARYGVDELGMCGNLASIVSGNAFADGFAVATMAAWTGAPILLTPAGSLHPEVGEYFIDGGGIGHNRYPGSGIGCYVIGGTGVISPAVYSQIRDLWVMP